MCAGWLNDILAWVFRLLPFLVVILVGLNVDGSFGTSDASLITKSFALWKL